MNKYLEQWIELEPVFSSGISREKVLDPRANVSWGELEQITLGAALSAGCALLESAGRKSTTNHIKVLFELRNAFIHNQCDISKNRNSSAYSIVENYLNCKDYENLFQPSDGRPFYELNGTNIIFKRGVISAIRMCLL